MDRSTSRRKHMTEYLTSAGFRHQRVRAITPHDVFIPNDLKQHWLTSNALTETSFPYASTSSETQAILRNHSVVITGLADRKKHFNPPSELCCTVSHLLAIREAIYSNRSTSPYALVTEDDVSFPFDIDFTALAKLAPQDFGIIQLYNINEDSLMRDWDQYVRTGQLFHEGYPHSRYVRNKYWSTGAYLINRAVLRPIIDALVRPLAPHTNTYAIKIIAAMKSPCMPINSECCKSVHKTANTSVLMFDPSNSICVHSPKGIGADYFLYALSKTYVLGVPLVANSVGSESSTIHQQHVSSHLGAIGRMQEVRNMLLANKTLLPCFSRPLLL